MPLRRQSCSSDPFTKLVRAYERGLRSGEWSSESGFALYLGVSQSTASAWLRRAKRPTGERVFVLLDRLGIDPRAWGRARLAHEVA